MAKYDAEFVAMAKRDRMPLFTLEVDRKYTLESNRGGKSLTKGVADPNQIPLLNFIVRTLHYQQDVQESIKKLQQELALLPPQSAEGGDA